MGIGNAASEQASSCSATSAHYPSWGSGTPDIGSGTGTSVGSLPLMGIGNRRLVLGMPPHAPLTTPHGDRERQVHQRPRDTRTELTTPHGDRERGCGTAGGVRRGAAHYPSWGSGTSHRGWPRPSHPKELTTPHGDREPSRAMGRRFDWRRSTHYPSWGSGTSASSALSWCPPVTHYPSWGSGTAGRPWTMRPSTKLTTPHGDRERLPHLLLRFERSSCSLPLMGIGNRRSSRPLSVTTSSSLPLMGIGNPCILAVFHPLVLFGPNPNGDLSLRICA